MFMEEERALVTAYGLRMISEGLAAGTSGNISVYNPETGYMAISPSGVPYEDTKAEDIVIMDLDGHIIDGAKKPSSEYELHSNIYKLRSDIRALVHAHSTYCTTLACMGEPLRAVHYAIADAGVATLPMAPYETFGTPQLAGAVAEAVGDKAKGLLMANHGMIAGGGSLNEAFSLALTMEWCAQIQWRCMCAGRMNVLTDEQMDAAFKRYSSYGQKKPEDGSGNQGYF